MVTDYDCWYEGHSAVTTEQVVAVLNQNGDNAIKVVRAAVAALPANRKCHCNTALRDAIITKHSVIPFATRQKLRLILDKYLQ